MPEHSCGTQRVRRHTEGRTSTDTGKVRIKQVRSGIGHSWRMRRTLEAIGLRHHQDVVIEQDPPSLRGQIKQRASPRRGDAGGGVRRGK